MQLKLIFTILKILFFLSLAKTQNISSFIHVDQFGYMSNSEKVAVISDPQTGYNATDEYQPGQTLELRSVSNDIPVFTNSIEMWNNGNTHTQSGDRGWWFDFSSFTEEGSYYIFDSTTNHRSAIFEINENPFPDVLQAATKMFYYNRCNAPKQEPFAQSNWIDIDNFTQDDAVRSVIDQTNAATERDLRGGWFDAGDYNKYVTFAHNTLHQLLTSYENNPDIFTDDWNIPESSNGVPDILDEIKYEFDWLYKMINADGTVILKMGSLEFDINDAAPPSNNSAPRFYTPTCSSASLSIASTHAHASKIYSEIPELIDFANNLESDAILCWNRFLDFYENNNLETNCDDLTVKAGDADWDEQEQINHAVIAAIYLFDLTGELQYSNFVRDNLNFTDPFINNAFGSQHTVFLEAILLYTTLENTDIATVNQILTQAESSVSREIYTSLNNDLYRVDLPDWNYYWGSNMTTANFANLSMTYRKYNIALELNEELERKAREVLHYFHGVNPQGLVYLSNMYQYGAERSANEIAHAWFIEGSDWDNALTSLYGPAPGFLSGGPNQGYSGALTPPANQPILKSYRDYNDWFTDPAYEITEPAIYYQAAYIQLLSNFVNTEIVSSIATIHKNEIDIEVAPNPSSGSYVISGDIKNNEIQVLDLNGKIIHSFYNKNSKADLNLTHLKSGMYFIRINMPKQSHTFLRKIIKL